MTLLQTQNQAEATLRQLTEYLPQLVQSNAARLPALIVVNAVVAVVALVVLRLVVPVVGKAGDNPDRMGTFIGGTVVVLVAGIAALICTGEALTLLTYLGSPEVWALKDLIQTVQHAR